MTRNLALRGDVRHVIIFDGGADDSFNNLLYTAGLTYEIGGKEEVREEVAEPEPEPEPAPVVVAPVAPTPPPAPVVQEQGSIIFRSLQVDKNKADIKPRLTRYSMRCGLPEANPNVKMEVQAIPATWARRNTT